MEEPKNNWLGPYIPQGSVFRDLVQQFKLAYNLLLDPRVHPLTKVIPFAALGYLLLPTDIAPDFLPVLGQLDDVAIVIFGLRMFFEFSPEAVVAEHLKKLAARIKGDWTVVDEAAGATPPSAPANPPSEVVDDDPTTNPMP
jgi:uncharacterized membrane protein YkvA (DUF1232 family)